MGPGWVMKYSLIVIVNESIIYGKLLPCGLRFHAATNRSLIDDWPLSWEVSSPWPWVRKGLLLCFCAAVQLNGR